MRPRRANSRRGFTLMELLVVIGIILVMTALSIPAISKFMDGQTLQQSGRIMQSAFNEARRSAITSRKPHYLIFFHDQLENPVREVFGLRVFQRGRVDGDGYTTDKYLLPATIRLQCDTSLGGAPGLYAVMQEPGTAASPNLVAGSPNSGCRIAVFDGCPFPGNNPNVWISNGTYGTYFDTTARRPITTSSNFGWLRFNRDGTVSFESGAGGARDVPQARIAGDSLYDLNNVYPEAQLLEDQILADITIRQIGEPKKRCYIDVDPNTGRVRYRVVQLNGYSGAAGGIGTTTDNG